MKKKQPPVIDSKYLDAAGKRLGADRSLLDSANAIAEKFNGKHNVGETAEFTSESFDNNPRDVLNKNH